MGAHVTVDPKEEPAISAWQKAAGTKPVVIYEAVGVPGMLDQAIKDAPPYEAIHAQYTIDSTFFATVRDRLGAGAAVFNLPYQPFPEAPPRRGVGEFELAAGYIFEPSLNWSFGYMRGREPDYPKVLETQPTTEWMTSVASIGFTGIVVDRAGYTVEEWGVEESEIAALAGPATLSADGRYSFFDLRAFAADVRTQLGDAGIKTRAAEALALQAPPDPVVLLSPVDLLESTTP